MPCQRYQLTHLPFQESVAPADLLVDGRFRHGLTRLAYFVESGDVAVLTGGTGLGKSSLACLFLDQLPANRYRPIVLQQSRLESAALLRMIVTELGEKPRLGKDRLFSQILEKTRHGSLVTILVVDEAHLLGEDTLTDLRLLTGPETAIKLLLVGQPDLSRILLRSRLADLANRIAIRHALFPLTPDQTRAYLDHRLARAGATPALLDDAAAQRLHEHAGGVPRLLNHLATLALLLGAQHDRPAIDRDLVDQAAVELRLL